MPPVLLPPPPDRPYPLPTFSAVGADRIIERLSALERHVLEGNATTRELVSQVAIEQSRVTLLVREVARLSARIGWRVTIGSAAGAGIAAAAAAIAKGLVG
jgi:hypothetical protein